MTDKPFTVYIADDHPVYREGVARAIRSHQHLELVGESGNGAEAADAIAVVRPDVVVTDLDMPGCDGLALTRRVAAAGLPTRVLILTGTVTDASIFEAVSAGAAGYISKDFTGAEICASVEAVARGEVVLGSDAQSSLARALRSQAQSERPSLTDRELEILELISLGFGAPHIAEHLGLSHATVKTHLGTLYRKLGVSDRAAAVAVGMRLGLLS